MRKDDDPADSRHDKPQGKQTFRFKLLNVLGFLLGVAGVVFVGKRLAQSWDALVANWNALQWIVLGAGMAFPFVFLLLNAMWKNILRDFGVRIDWSTAFKIFGESQICKYIPGNITLFIGHQVIGCRFGIPALPLAKSIFIQQAAMAASALCFLPALAFLDHRHSSFLIPLSCIGAASISMGIIHRTAGRHSCIGFVESLGYYFLQGMIFTIIMFSVGDDHRFNVKSMAVCGVSFIMGIVIGQITPGAPAGIGVREAVVTYYIADAFHQEQIVIAVALTRAANIIGDIILFLAAVVWPVGSFGRRSASVESGVD